MRKYLESAILATFSAICLPVSAMISDVPVAGSAGCPQPAMRVAAPVVPINPKPSTLNLGQKPKVTVDTIVTRDTIIRKEVITRTDIITRTEVTVRRDSVLPKGSVINLEGELPPTPQAQNKDIIHIGKGIEIIPAVSTPEVSKIESQPKADPQPSTLNPQPNSQLSILNSKFSIPEEDPNELVLFRGDTIPMRLKTRNFGRFDRGLFNYLYVPKRVWQVGATASYGEISTKDLEVLDLMSDIDISGQILSVKPYVSYFIGNNTSLGIKLIYSKGTGRVNSFNVDVDDDVNFNLHDIRYNSETYAAAFALKQYYGISRRGRFALFNEVELFVSAGTSDFTRPHNSELRATHTNTKKVALNFSPGLSVFIVDPVSFNVSFGVFGLQLTKQKQTEDGEPIGSRLYSSANFRFNIFNIDFGLAISF